MTKKKQDTTNQNGLKDGATPHQPYLAKKSLAQQQDDEPLLSGDSALSLVRYPLLLAVFVCVGILSLVWKKGVSVEADTAVLEQQAKIDEILEKNKEGMEFWRRLGMKLPDEMFKPRQQLSPQEQRILQGLDLQNRVIEERERRLKEGEK